MVSRPQEVSTNSEEILHDTVNRREPLELSGRLETPHLALTLSGRLMGGLRAVVRVLIGAVKHRWHHRATGGRVAAQLVGNQGRLRRRRGRFGDLWHLDEVFVTIQGRQQYLWRAVDEDGDVLDILVQPRRNRHAAVRFFRKLLKTQRHVPRRLITALLHEYPLRVGRRGPHFSGPSAGATLRG